MQPGAWPFARSEAPATSPPPATHRHTPPPAWVLPAADEPGSPFRNTNSPEVRSPGGLFQLLPEGQQLAGMSPGHGVPAGLPWNLAVAAQLLEAAGSSDSEVEVENEGCGGDLSSFLEGLKSKYGLRDHPRTSSGCTTTSLSVHVRVESSGGSVSSRPHSPVRNRWGSPTAKHMHRTLTVPARPASPAFAAEFLNRAHSASPAFGTAPQAPSRSASPTFAAEPLEPARSASPAFADAASESSPQASLAFAAAHPPTCPASSEVAAVPSQSEQPASAAVAAGAPEPYRSASPAHAAEQSEPARLTDPAFAAAPLDSSQPPSPASEAALPVPAAARTLLPSSQSTDVFKNPLFDSRSGSTADEVGNILPVTPAFLAAQQAHTLGTTAQALPLPLPQTQTQTHQNQGWSSQPIYSQQPAGEQQPIEAGIAFRDRPGPEPTLAEAAVSVPGSSRASMLAAQQAQQQSGSAAGGMATAVNSCPTHEFATAAAQPNAGGLALSANGNASLATSSTSVPQSGGLLQHNAAVQPAQELPLPLPEQQEWKQADTEMEARDQEAPLRWQQLQHPQHEGPAQLPGAEADDLHACDGSPRPGEGQQAESHHQQRQEDNSEVCCAAEGGQPQSQALLQQLGYHTISDVFDEELDAELRVLEDLQRQLTEQQQQQQQLTEQYQQQQQQLLEQQQQQAQVLLPQSPAGHAASSSASREVEGMLSQGDSSCTEPAVPDDAGMQNIAEPQGLPAAGPAASAGHTLPKHQSLAADAPARHAPFQPSPGQSLLQVEQRRLPWTSLHTLLVQRGFPGLLPHDTDASSAAEHAGWQPEAATVFEVLHSLLQEQERSSAYQRRLTEAAQGAQRREEAFVASFSAAAKQKDAEIAKWKQLALENQKAARDAQQSSRQCGRAGEQLAAEARHLQNMISHLQNEVHSREEEVGRLRHALDAQAEREQRRAKGDKEALERLNRAYAASKAADTPTAAAALFKAGSGGGGGAGGSREVALKPLDLMRIFEAERANLQEQAAVAVAEARAAQAQLQRAQEALHAAGLPYDKFEEVEGQARAAARQAAAAEERAAQLAEEAAALRAELGARPTQAQLESLQRQVGIMERQLVKAAADRERAAAEAKEAKSRTKTELTTREQMQRDRNIQRLGLQCVETLPKPVLVEIVQDACALLECSKPLELCAAIKPVQDLAALVPRMERFIGDVCGAVFQRGLAHVPEAMRQDNPGDVPAILATWIAELGELVEMRGVLRALLRQLASRVSMQPTDPPPTAGEVVPLVASLVELERKVFHSREVIQAAETALAAQPDVLINRICLQFQRLFGCHSLEGALPAMNKLYLSHTEAQTFLASLRTALGLEPSATLEACTNRLQQLLSHNREALASMLPASDAHAAAPVLPRSAQAVVVEVPRRQSGPGLQEAAQVAVERMAAKRRWPQVQIFVTAGGQAAGDREVEEGHAAREVGE